MLGLHDLCRLLGMEEEMNDAQKVVFFTDIDDAADFDGVILRSKSGAGLYATAGGFVKGTIRDLLVPKDLI